MLKWGHWGAVLGLWRVGHPTTLVAFLHGFQSSSAIYTRWWQWHTRVTQTTHWEQSSKHVSPAEVIWIWKGLGENQDKSIIVLKGRSCICLFGSSLLVDYRNTSDWRAVATGSTVLVASEFSDCIIAVAFVNNSFCEREICHRPELITVRIPLTTMSFNWVREWWDGTEFVNDIFCGFCEFDL